MNFNDDGKTHVKKFLLEDELEKSQYEDILNNPNCEVIRDEFTYDKLGKAMITIWYVEFE